MDKPPSQNEVYKELLELRRENQTLKRKLLEVQELAVSFQLAASEMSYRMKKLTKERCPVDDKPRSEDH